MFENYSLEEKIVAFESALNSMDYKPEFANKLREIIMSLIDRIQDLKPLNISRALAHNTLLSSSAAQELADRYFEYLTEGKHKTSFERIFGGKLKESDIRRIAKKVLG